MIELYVKLVAVVNVIIFTARRYANAVYVVVVYLSVRSLSLCLYVVYVLPIQLLGCHSCNKRLSCLSCLSITSRSSTKTVKPRIAQTKAYDSPGTLVFRCQNLSDIPKRSPPRGPNRGEVGSNRRFSTNISLYISETVQDRDTDIVEG